MRKKNILLIAIALAIFAASALAQRPTRITFKRGARSTVVTGTLSGYKSSRNFVIFVKAGQKMHIEGIGNNPVSVFIEGPKGSGYVQDMAADCHGNNEIDPTAKGDYTFSVVECQKADRWRGKFRVKITVN